jgi:hypothetical protein
MQLNNQTIFQYLSPNLTKTYSENLNRRSGECDRPKLLAVWKIRRTQSSGRLCGCGAGKPPLYITDNLFSEVVFNEFRVTETPENPCFQGLGLLLEVFIELSAQLIDIIDFSHLTP